MKIKKEGRNITLENFLEFYTKKVTREENAQYLRQNTGYEEKENLQKPHKALLLHTTGGYTKYNNVENTCNHVPRKTIQHYRAKGVSRGRPKNSGHYENNDAQKMERNNPDRTLEKGTSRHRYCIFCEKSGHDTAYCRIDKYTAQYKEAQCSKHNACYMCFKTTEHISATCSQRIPCYLCKKIHHYNNNTKKEINSYFNKRKFNNRNQQEK